MSDFRLKVFQSVAKNLSFTKASQELFVSQPAITKHIQELETYYQARLFERQGSKISLTVAGELLLKHSEKILDDYKRLEYEMHLLHKELAQRLLNMFCPLYWLILLRSFHKSIFPSLMETLGEWRSLCKNTGLNWDWWKVFFVYLI